MPTDYPNVVKKDLKLTSLTMMTIVFIILSLIETIVKLLWRPTPILFIVIAIYFSLFVPNWWINILSVSDNILNST